MGLWLSRPRVQDKVAVASVISSTITTPGGPGGPGGARGKIKQSVSTAEPPGRRGHGRKRQSESLLLVVDTQMSATVWASGATCWYSYGDNSSSQFKALNNTEAWTWYTEPTQAIPKGYRPVFQRHFSHFCCVLDLPVFYYSRTYVYLGVRESM